MPTGPDAHWRDGQGRGKAHGFECERFGLATNRCPRGRVRRMRRASIGAGGLALVLAMAGPAGCSLSGLDGLKWNGPDAGPDAAGADASEGGNGADALDCGGPDDASDAGGRGDAMADASSDVGSSGPDGGDAGADDGGGSELDGGDAGADDGGSGGCPCSEPNQHCDAAQGKCVPNSTCADHSATGQVGQPCSALPSSAFPDGAGNDLTCDCSRESTANNFCVWSNETSAGTCYDFTLDWARWPVPQSSTLEPRYLPSLDGTTVTDQATGLVWQRVTPSETGTSSHFLFHWSEAKSHCQNLELGGFSSGWRLPTRVELLSLVDFARMDPAIDATAFPNTTSSSFWSATPSTAEGFAWGVNFFDGQSDRGFLAEVSSLRVRCVR